MKIAIWIADLFTFLHFGHTARAQVRLSGVSAPEQMLQDGQVGADALD